MGNGPKLGCRFKISNLPHDVRLRQGKLHIKLFSKLNAYCELYLCLKAGCRVKYAARRHPCPCTTNSRFRVSKSATFVRGWQIPRRVVPVQSLPQYAQQSAHYISLTVDVAIFYVLLCMLACCRAIIHRAHAKLLPAFGYFESSHIFHVWLSASF
jgi:hypothetical protein